MGHWPSCQRAQRICKSDTHLQPTSIWGLMVWKAQFQLCYFVHYCKQRHNKLTEERATLSYRYDWLSGFTHCLRLSTRVCKLGSAELHLAVPSGIAHEQWKQQVAKPVKSKDLFLYDKVHSLPKFKERQEHLVMLSLKDFVPQEAFYFHLLKS